MAYMPRQTDIVHVYANRYARLALIAAPARLSSSLRARIRVHLLMRRVALRHERQRYATPRFIRAMLFAAMRVYSRRAACYAM